MDQFPFRERVFLLKFFDMKWLREKRIHGRILLSHHKASEVK